MMLLLRSSSGLKLHTFMQHLSCNCSIKGSLEVSFSSSSSPSSDGRADRPSAVSSVVCSGRFVFDKKTPFHCCKTLLFVHSGKNVTARVTNLHRSLTYGQ